MAMKGRKVYKTISEAAEEFGVSAKTVRDWIMKGIIPEPPTIDHGIRVIKTFPPDYMRQAKAQLEERRKQRGLSRS